MGAEEALEVVMNQGLNKLSTAAPSSQANSVLCWVSSPVHPSYPLALFFFSLEQGRQQGSDSSKPSSVPRGHLHRLTRVRVGRAPPRGVEGRVTHWALPDSLLPRTLLPSALSHTDGIPGTELHTAGFNPKPCSTCILEPPSSGCLSQRDLS